MTLIVDVLSRIARQVSIDQPTSWVSASDLEHVEIRDDFFLETVEDITDRCDLPSPIGKTYTLTGDGSEVYALPEDFKRLQRDRLAVYETTTVRRRMVPVTDDGFWTHLKEIGSTGAERFFRITGYKGNFDIAIYREPAASIEVKIHYVSTNWMVNGSTYGDAFTDPEDVLLLPRRVVEAGAVMRWRERKGLDASGKRAEYEALISRLSNDSRNRRTVYFGEPYTERRPWNIPVPDQIPES